MSKKSRVVIVIVGLLAVGAMVFGGGRFVWRTVRALHGIHD